MLSWRRDKKDEATAHGGVPSSPSPTPSPTAPTSPAAMAPGARPQRLGELLVHEGVVTSAQLQEALKTQAETGAFLGQILVEMGCITQSTLVSFLVKQCKIPHISLLDYNVGEDLFKLVPKGLCRRYRLLPIDKLGKILTLAMVDPLDATALEKVREHCPDLRIKPILCTWAHFEQVARKLFNDEPTKAAEVSMSTYGLSKKAAPTTEPAAGVDQAQASAAVAQLVKEVAGEHKQAPQPGPASKSDPAKGGTQAAPAPTNPAAKVEPRAPGMAAEAMLERLGNSMRTALIETITPLMADQQKLIALQLESSKSTPQELAREIAANMRSALQDSLLPLIEARHAPAAAQLDTAALSKELGDSVRAAMLDAVLPALQQSAPGIDTSSLVKELVAGVKEAVTQVVAPLAESRAKTAAAPAFDGAALVKELRAAVSDAVRPLFETRTSDEHMSKLLASIESSSAAQVSQVAQLTDATRQALMAVREALEGMKGRESAEQERATNVALFPGLRAAVPTVSTDALHVDPLEEVGLGVDADDRVREALLSGRLQRGFTFDAFLSGAQNTFTLSVARAVTEKFSREFTPFFIYGDVGVGKTHLLHAIGNAMHATNPDLRVGYMTGLRFVSACERAARDQDLEKFRESFAHWDALLFDDAQSLADHKQAQDELRAVLGVLTSEGRLVVVSADRAPDQLPNTSHQLVSRLSAGIVARLHAPDMPTRVAILQRHARALKAKVADDILALIASRVPTDVRKMTGALRKALAFAQVAGSEITQELAEEILSHLTATEAA